jgi:AmiR/NasT family two-component response regulator
MATLMAGRAASNAVQQALRSAEDHNSLESEWSPALRREVHQATGILISQLDLSATDAFSLLQGHVFASGKPIDQIAHDVVLRALVFSHTPE